MDAYKQISKKKPAYKLPPTDDDDDILLNFAAFISPVKIVTSEENRFEGRGVLKCKYHRSSFTLR